ncbi:MAG: thioredoxin [Sedimentisphaerales bacterium]|nr:thioredoxin [Sedimentisphaerales bacterium]
MTRVTFIQLIVGLLIGGSLGALMGTLGRCSTGACPLTANPWRGALLGAMIGGLFAWSFGASRTTVEPAGGEHAAVQIGSVEDFNSQVLGADKPVLVDFYSDSCPPCRRLAPTIEQLAKQYEGQALISKVNVDKLPQVADRYGIQGIPAVLFFKNGQEVQRLVGLRSQQAYADVLDKL